MHLRTLGGLELEGAAVARRRPLLLCAYLAFEGGKERRHLAELFWGDTQDPAANLRVALSQLRRAIGAALVEDRGRLRTTLATDAQMLLEDLSRGVTGRLDTYRGPFLAGVEGNDVGAEFEEWILETRTFIASRLRAGVIGLAERRSERLEHASACRLAERAIAIGPLDEFDPERLPSLHAILAAGGSAAAAKVAALAREYGVDLAMTASPAHADDGVDERSRHRAARVSLPRSTTRFVGRLPELARVAELLDEPSVGVVTLLGGAGAGKTRLAIEVARHRLDAGRVPDGAVFVDLSDVHDVTALPDRIAAAAGVVVLTGSDEVDQLARALADRRLLLVLDNLEQLRPAAPVVGHLVRSCPDLDIVVTSRERLDIGEEWVVPVGGLTLPDPRTQDAAEILAADAARLFARRTARVRGGPIEDAEADDVRRVCVAVAGNPLALELAAPWTRVLPIAHLADELERDLGLLESGHGDLPERHRGLRAAFDHSWKLLGAGERRALRRLSVFRGGFDREGATMVADAGLTELARLVDASLLTVDDQGRFDRHPLLYAYTEEQLATEPEERDDSRARHGRAVLDMLADLYPRVMGGADAVDAFRRLHDDEANVTAAWAWALETGAWDRLERALPCVAVYAEFQARYHFGHRLAHDVVVHFADAAPDRPILLALAHALRGFCVFRAGDPERVEADGRAALALLEENDAQGSATEALWWTHHCLAMAAKVRADGANCIAHSYEALALAEDALAAAPAPSRLPVLSVMAGINHHVVCLGATVAGDLARAAHHDRMSRVHLRRVDSHADAYGAQTTGLLALLAGDAEGALRSAHEGLELARRVGYVTAVANLLEIVARAELARGDVERATAACEEALEITVNVGDAWLGTSLQAFMGTVAAADGRRQDALKRYALAFAMAERYAVLGYGMEAVLGRAQLAVDEGRDDVAAALVGVVRGHPYAPSWLQSAAAEAAAHLPDPPSSPWTLDQVRATLLPGG